MRGVCGVGYLPILWHSNYSALTLNCCVTRTPIKNTGRGLHPVNRLPFILKMYLWSRNNYVLYVCIYVLGLRNMGVQKLFLPIKRNPGNCQARPLGGVPMRRGFQLGCPQICKQYIFIITDPTYLKPVQRLSHSAYVHAYQT